MSFFDEVYEKRRKLSEVLVEYAGIRTIVEDLYPDRAHFIYELLQNAEDTRATEAKFELEPTGLTFEHNGRPFTENNVWAITDIGNGTKKNEPDKIGRFGVGFKAVFAYSETPHIWSDTFCFKISNLVLPTAIAEKPELNGKTCFRFPFNNPKKAQEDAYSEVMAGLNELAETTLLFLTHIEVIQWYIDGRMAGEVRRIQHSDAHIEIVRQVDKKVVGRSHFLRFVEQVTGLEHQRVAIAYCLDLLPNVSKFDVKKPITKQFRVVPATPGLVAVFFPAEKEASGLRFHLHAPFVPEVSRASVKNTPANDPLFTQIAALTSRSLYRVRDLELLTSDFLAILPNPSDSIPERYQQIRHAIVAEMNQNPLTPTHTKTYAPAKSLVQAKASLKELLSPDDVATLLDYKDVQPQWAVGAPQKNSNVDRFLMSLAIRTWDAEAFITLLEEKSTAFDKWLISFKRVTGPDAEFMKWLASKPTAWHQQLYAFLYNELKPEIASLRLRDLKIVRLKDSTYSIGSECYFSSDDDQHDDMFPRVDRAAYQSGKNKGEQEDARKLLELIRVRDVAEVDDVRAILKARYQKGDSFKPDLSEVKRFITLVEKDPMHATLFSDYHIICRADDNWGKPSQAFLGLPYSELDLEAYFENLGPHNSVAAMSPKYAELAIPIESIVKFAKAVGVRVRLDMEIVGTTIWKNPEKTYLLSVPGDRSTSPIDEDFWIPHLETMLEIPHVRLSRLIWNSFCGLSADSSFFSAKHQRNKSNGCHTAPSQLIHTLRKSKWVPQGDGVFVRPSEADRARLPGGFPFDSESSFLKRLEFGQAQEKFVEEIRAKEAQAEELTKQLGFRDKDTLNRAQAFAKLPIDEQTRILARSKARTAIPLPERDSKDPKRRAEKIAERARKAPERLSEPRTRSVTVGLAAVKELVHPYLQEQYTNTDGVMICQICKDQLPFKLEDGEYYFEKVEFLTNLKKFHRENYLALCPNHSAMYQYANDSRDDMMMLLEQMESNEIQIWLAQEESTVYFTKMHIADLKAVIEADRSEG